MLDGHIQVFSTDGVPQGSILTGAQLGEQLSTDGTHLYLADHGGKELKCFTTGGQLLWKVGPVVTGYPYPSARFSSVTVADDGTIYAGDFDNRRILVFSPPPTATLGETFGAIKARYR